VSDIDTAVADSLKVLDPKRPIREADMMQTPAKTRFLPEPDLRLDVPAIKALTVRGACFDRAERVSPIVDWNLNKASAEVKSARKGALIHVILSKRGGSGQFTRRTPICIEAAFIFAVAEARASQGRGPSWFACSLWRWSHSPALMRFPPQAKSKLHHTESRLPRQGITSTGRQL
jgi:hypothetical protein